MAALQSLNQTTADLTKTENTVSTGKSVNTASDNPAMYSIAQNMTAQISTLSGVSTGLSFSAQVLNTATTGLSSISSALQSLATTIGTNTTGVDNSTLNDAITKTLASIDSAATGAKFQGVNLLSGATGNGTTYTSLSTAMDAQGSTFTQNGFNVTSAGLGLTNLSMDMSGSSLALGSSTTTGTFATNNIIQLKNTTAASTTATPTAATPAVSYDFVADNQASAGQGTAMDMLSKAVGGAVGDFTLGTDGKLSAKSSATVQISSQTTASDGSITYSLSNGDSISQSKDGNGNSVYTANTAFDSNGNATTKSVITDVNTSSASSLSTAGGTSSAQSVAQVNLMTQAMEYQGFGVSRDSSNNLTIAGNSIDATSTQMGTFQSPTTDTIALGSTTPFNTTGSTSAITVGNNVFVAQTTSGDNSALNFLDNKVNGGATDNSILGDLTVDSTGKLTAAAGSDSTKGLTLGSGTTNSDGSTTYALTNTASGTTAGSIVQSTDKQGNAVYSYTASTGANTVVTNIDMPTDAANQVTAMQQAMAAQGITATTDSSNNLTVTPTDNVAVSVSTIAPTTGVASADGTRAVTLTKGPASDATFTAGAANTTTGFTGKATAVTGANVVSAVVQAAISSVTRTASSIGYSSTTISNLQTTTSSLSDALTTGVGALTDADLAAESAKLTSLQTKQQLAVQALSIANSQSSTLLSLFRG
ncbi:hypothetical protein A0U94_11430 [Gluconobacter albidus]|nr:hypothetical protein A0U94_11430 [Gluconobacter albidus]